MPFIAISLLIAAAIGGGASVAAQNSLPGDALWGFKVGVNENVQAALAAEGKAQADFDIGAIEARMKEAAQLSANGRFNAEARANIEQNFEGHVKSVQTQITNLQAKGDYGAAADIAARFQATVAANASALSEAGASAESSADISAEVKSTVRSSVQALMLIVRSTLETASTVSADASAKAAVNGEANGGFPADNASATGTTQATTNANVNGQTNGSASSSNSGTIKVETNGGVQIGL